MLKARVVLIFKEGDTDNLSTYRPISLLNTIYKIYAAIIMWRIEAGLQKFLQEAQYGFRKARGATQAVYLARRLIEHGKGANLTTVMVLLDWEKAFDKVIHEGLFQRWRG